jgi:uncharacterized metal-binding protein
MPKNIPQMIPQGDQESTRRQVTQSLNRIGTQLAKSDHRTAPMDLGHNRIANVADPGAPTDAVNLRTLKKVINDIGIQHNIRKAATTSLYSIVFSSTGQVFTGQLSAPYIVMPNREGRPLLVKVAATVSGSGQSKFNVAHNGSPILATDIILPASSNGVITANNFIPGFSFDIDDLITPVVTGAGGASLVTIEIEVFPNGI